MPAAPAQAVSGLQLHSKDLGVSLVPRVRKTPQNSRGSLPSFQGNINNEGISSFCFFSPDS